MELAELQITYCLHRQGCLFATCAVIGDDNEKGNCINNCNNKPDC
jgi:hypothetical protein